MECSRVARASGAAARGFEGLEVNGFDPLSNFSRLTTCAQVKILEDLAARSRVAGAPWQATKRSANSPLGGGGHPPLPLVGYPCSVLRAAEWQRTTARA